MAKLLLGKRRGETVKLHQWCNDWFMLEDGRVVSPQGLWFTSKEMKEIQLSSTGIMMQLFNVVPKEGGFVMKKIIRPRNRMF